MTIMLEIVSMICRSHFWVFKIQICQEGGGRRVINIEPPPLFPTIFHSFWRLHWQLYQIYQRTRISEVLHMIFRFCVWAHLRSGHELVFYLREIPTGFWRDLFLLFWGRFRLFRTCTWGFWHRALAPAPMNVDSPLWHRGEAALARELATSVLFWTCRAVQPSVDVQSSLWKGAISAFTYYLSSRGFFWSSGAV